MSSRPGARHALALLLLALPLPGLAENSQSRLTRPEEPQILTFRLYNIEAGMEAEQETEETTFKQSGTHSSYQRTYLAPTISMAGSGSVYHPSFLRFSLAGEGSYGDAHEEFDSGTPGTRNSMQHFERLRGRMDMFSNKPLRGSAHGNYGRSYRDYDFFTRSTVESLGYGAQTLYEVPALYGSATYNRTEETVLDEANPSTTAQDVLGLDWRQDRRHGSSSANYTYGENAYWGSDSRNRHRSTDHSVSVADHERFGQRERVQFNNGASASHRDSENLPNDQYQVTSALEVEHRANLNSTYNINYDRFEDPTLTSDTLAGGAGLHHQLYESLQSSLTGEAGESRFVTQDASDRSSTVGAGLAEGYTKRIGRRHHLQMDASVFVNSVDQSSPGRAVNERHTFPTPPNLEVVVLDLPNVAVETIVVTDSGALRPYTRGIDYEVFPRGSRTEIRRISGGSIPEGSTVLVSYDADGRGSGRYRSMTESYGFRLNLWENVWGLYARMSASHSDAPDGLFVLDSTRTIMGTDLNVQHAQLGAEREVYQSDDTDYVSSRLFQSLWANPDAYSTAGLSASETFTDRADQDEQERDYRLTGRYRRNFTHRLSLGLQAGVDRRRGAGVDQDLLVVRPELYYRIGQTTLEAYYDYEHNLYLDREERNRERFYATIKRTF